MHLLVIDQSNLRGNLLATRLGEAGFRPNVVRTLTDAFASPSRDTVRAVLVDQGRQCGPAADLVRPMREHGFAQPLIVLSDRDDWREKVECLDAGADDFLVKPLRSEEVAARLRAVIRRSAGIASNRIYQYGIDLDLKQQCAWKGGDCLGLSRNEFRLLRLFVLSQGRPVTREDIRGALWGNAFTVTENAIEVQVARLRRKLGEGSIKTLRGLGYSLMDPKSEQAPLPERSQCRKGDCSTGDCEDTAEKPGGDAFGADSALYI